MPPSPDSLIEDFADALVDCRKIYRDAALRCAGEENRPGGRSRRELRQWMDELHQGLLIKVYMDVAAADRQWQPAEQQLAQVLIEHTFGRTLTGTALRDATKGLRDRARKLTLRAVAEPFVQYAGLRDDLADLATVVLRVANLVAKADGELSPRESEKLHQIGAEFEALVSEAMKGSQPPGLPPSPSVSSSVVTDRQDSEEADNAASDPAKQQDQLRDGLEQLDQLIGLHDVKSEVRTLANFLKIQKQRQAAGLPETPISLHLVFEGNPGTGKTTVARIIGQIYGAMGILKRGHLIETDRSGLVASYAGQTASKTNAKIDEAIDGVLFVDEAYSLISDEGEDAFGHEALQTLLKRMEDDRHRLAVILAGYPEPMDQLLNSNPGLASRFSRTLKFPDYDGVELARIFGALCAKNRYELTRDVRHRILVGLDWLYQHRDRHFGNGRLVRNLFEDAIRRLSNRIVNITPLTRELLTQFRPEDFPFTRVASRAWDDYSADSTQYEVACSGCERRSRVTAVNLGRRVRCRGCQHQFVIDWPKIIAAKDLE